MIWRKGLHPSAVGKVAAAVLFLVIARSPAFPAYAAPQAIDLITDTVAKICNMTSGGEAASYKAKGMVRVQLNGPPPPLPSPTPLNISGRWRDKLGGVYQIDQQGGQFTFTIEGVSCKGQPYRSRGQGTIVGDKVTSHYESSIGSTGNCSATMTDSGWTGTCTDTICGSFPTVGFRQ
jgi:hypothetical protein